MAEEVGRFTVVVAVDRSKQADEAFDYYVKNIHQPTYKVVLVHVPEGPTIATTKGMRLNEGALRDMRIIEEKETGELVTKYTAILKDANVEGYYKTVYASKCGEGIVDTAKEIGANLVVMGTRGMGKVRRTILGSVSDYVMHHAHVPVMICRH